VRDCVRDPFASVIWVVRSRVLLKAFWEQDCSVLAPSFYEILEYSTIFNCVAQHTMVGAELVFARPVYVCGSLASGERQFSFHGLLKYSSYFALQETVWPVLPDLEGWHSG
jgi:hypothetical protein